MVMLIRITAIVLFLAVGPAGIRAAPLPTLLLCTSADALAAYIDQMATRPKHSEPPERYGCFLSSYAGVTPLDSAGMQESRFARFEMLEFVRSTYASDGSVVFGLYFGFRNFTLKLVPATRIPMVVA